MFTTLAAEGEDGEIDEGRERREEEIFGLMFSF
jgi:hypothetical protein